MAAIWLIAAGASASDQGLELRLERPLADHPRLLLGPERFEGLLAKAGADPHLGRVWAFVEAGAGRALTAEPVQRAASPEEALQTARTCLQRVCYLALAYGVTGREAYLRRAETEMLAEAAIDPADPGAAVLTQRGQRLVLRVVEPAGARLERIDVSQPPGPLDAVNPGAKMIVFSTALPAYATAVLKVSLGDG